jgi:hypothetical protein
MDDHYLASCGERIYRYRAFGFVIESRIEFSHFPEETEKEPDIFIRHGDVAETLENRTFVGYKFEANRTHILINTNLVAKLLIYDGKTIIVDPRPGARDIEIRLLLFGWGIGALLHQRGMLPLHASVISTGNCAVAFCAPSGTGKSTIIPYFLNRGYLLMDDNIASIRVEDGTPMVFPGSPELKLNRDALSAWEENLFPIEGLVLRKGNKYSVNVRQQYEVMPVPLKMVFILVRKESGIPESKQLRGASLFQSLTECTFGLHFARGMGRVGEHLKLMMDLAKIVPIFEVQFSVTETSAEVLSEFLERKFRE